MKGRMRPYLPELTIRDYNTYQWYQRGVRRQLYTTYVQPSIEAASSREIGTFLMKPV